MNSRVSIVVAVIVLLALIGAGVTFFVSSGTGPSPVPIGAPPQDVDEEPTADREPAEIRTGETAVDVRQTPGRTEVDVTSTGAEFHQGVVGRTVDANGAPVADATVYLFDNRTSNMFETMIRAQQGVIVPPIAEVRSDSYGRFKLGYAGDPTDRTFEIRAIHPDHAEGKKAAPQLFAEKFWDAGDIAMGRGLIVEGQVIDALTRQPIADAIVRLKNQQSMLTLTPTPGQEQGIEVLTDQTGHYRCANTGLGVWTISAVASHYAQVEHTNAVLSENGPNRFDFELPEGKSIAGIVTNADGTPISGAKLTAYAISSKMQMSTETRTGTDGRFELLGLVDGLFAVKASAPGFVAEERKPVKAGSTEEHLVLETQGGVHLRVAAQNGKRIDAYSASVKSYNAERIGNLMHVPPHNVTSRLLQGGSYHLTGLDPGSYKLEIQAEGYAKAYSDAFTITAGGPDVELTVLLSQGGEIDGMVLGMNGEPLAGALVETMPNGLQNNEIMAIFRPMMAVDISERQTKTGPKGLFKLPRLIAGTYQVQITHPDYSNLSLQDIVVEDGQTTHLGDLAMQPGTLVTGSVTVDGQPTAQVKITVSSAPPEVNSPTPAPMAGGVSVTTFTDDSGQFTLPKRLPPGRYNAQAARQDPAQPFLMLLDFNQTRTEFQVMPGQPHFQHHFAILSNPPAQPLNPMLQPPREPGAAPVRPGGQ